MSESVLAIMWYMPPAAETGNTGASEVPAVAAPHKDWVPYIVIGAVAVMIASVVAYSFVQRPRAVEVSVFECGEGLSWHVSQGESVSDTYGGQISARACVYADLALRRAESKVFSVSNFTDCRDFNSDIDLFNGIDEPLYELRSVFPAGHPIIAAVAARGSTSTLESTLDKPVPSQFGLQIASASGLSPQEFVRASQCLLDHRKQIADEFGSINRKGDLIGWVALVDETAAAAPGDLPGSGQVFSCQNGVEYRLSDEVLFSLRPGEPATAVDEFGIQYNTDKQVAVIGFNGELYQPNSENGERYIVGPYEDFRRVDEATLPAALSSCVDNRNVLLVDYLASLAQNVVYDPRPELYEQRQIDRGSEANAVSVGVGPSAAQNAACIERYDSVVNDVAQSLSGEGIDISSALFFSPTLERCVGVVRVIEGAVTNYETFDASTGNSLSMEETVAAFDDWQRSESE